MWLTSIHDAFFLPISIAPLEKKYIHDCLAYGNIIAFIFGWRLQLGDTRVMRKSIKVGLAEK